MKDQNNKSTDKKVSEIVSTSDGFKISGALVYSSASSLLEKSKSLIKNNKVEGDSFNFDCSDVTRIDSAGIALLIEWKRMSDQKNKLFSVINLPDQANSLVDTYRLKNVLQ